MSPPTSQGRPGGNATRTAQKSNAKDYEHFTSVAVPGSNELSLVATGEGVASVLHTQAMPHVLDYPVNYRTVFGWGWESGTNGHLLRRGPYCGVADRQVGR